MKTSKTSEGKEKMFIRYDEKPNQASKLVLSCLDLNILNERDPIGIIGTDVNRTLKSYYFFASPLCVMVAWKRNGSRFVANVMKVSPSSCIQG